MNVLRYFEHLMNYICGKRVDIQPIELSEQKTNQHKIMLTKYFMKVSVRFNPFGKEAKTARLFLSAIPPLQRQQGTVIQNELLTNGSTKTPLLKVTFKDKKEMETDPSTMSFQEVANLFDSHSRKLALKETIEKQ